MTNSETIGKRLLPGGNHRVAHRNALENKTRYRGCARQGRGRPRNRGELAPMPNRFFGGGSAEGERPPRAMILFSD